MDRGIEVRETKHAPEMTVAEYISAIGKLPQDDRDELEWAARNHTSVMDSMRPMFVELGLIYRKTGKVRPLAAKLLMGILGIPNG